MKNSQYDIIIIGAGSGGLNIAGFMNKAGFKVLLIDKKDENIGGDCLNYGCVPSKALIHVAKEISSAQKSAKYGLKIQGKINLKKVMNYVQSKKEIIREHENAKYFKSIGMHVALGNAKFVSTNSVEVAGKLYTGKKILLATGSRPRKLHIPGIEKVNYQTNETIFDLKTLPNQLIIIGGGPIGIELGQAFRRLGSEVTIIIRDNKFLPKETPEMAKILLKQLKKEGIVFMFNTTPKQFLTKNSLEVEKAGKKSKIKFDKVLVSIGRQLNIEGLKLDKAKINHDEKSIFIDKYLRTTNKNVYVCGDIAGAYQFTHAAELHAGILINNFFNPIKKKVNYDKLSWVTYTSPEIATFGLNENQLKNRKINYERLELDFQDDDRSIIDDYRDGKLVLYINKNKILGGSMIAINAGELFQELVLACSSNLDIKEIFNKIYPYPTASRVNKKIISNLFSKKLTPTTKKLFKLMY